MFLIEKSPRSYVGLYQNVLYKIFSLLLTPPPPKHHYHTSPNVTTAASGPRSTVFCDPQEAVPVCSYQFAFPKYAADAELGVDSAGFTPLHLVVWVDGKGVIERARTLLQADPDAEMMTNTRGCTPCIPLSSGSPQQPC